MKRIKALGIVIIVCTLASLVDSVAYMVYSFNRGYFFLAPFDHIVAFHSEGIGLITLIVMVLSLIAVIGITYILYGTDDEDS